MVRCDAYDSMRFLPMWETTFPSNTVPIPTPDWASPLTMKTYCLVCRRCRLVLAQSGVGISRKCCFPHGFLHKKIGRFTNRCIWSVQVRSDAVHIVRCGSCLCKTDQSDYDSGNKRMHMVRCGSCLYKTDQSDYEPMRCGAYDPMRLLFVQNRSVGTNRCKCMLPNEDFGRQNKRSRVRFLSTFQLFVAQIEYSHP